MIDYLINQPTDNAKVFEIDIQGYYFGHPVSKYDFIKLLT